MKNLRQAQVIVKKIDAKYNVFGNEKSVKWNQIYQSEAEILNDLKQIHIPESKELYLVGKLYKGYNYIHSFAKQVQNGKVLSDKQMTQCKRLALEIKKAVSIKDCF
mgnify:CR=1 FL=1